jgi:hypothetical protein
MRRRLAGMWRAVGWLETTRNVAAMTVLLVLVVLAVFYGLVLLVINVVGSVP